MTQFVINVGRCELNEVEMIGVEEFFKSFILSIFISKLECFNLETILIEFNGDVRLLDKDSSPITDLLSEEPWLLECVRENNYFTIMNYVNREISDKIDLILSQVIGKDYSSVILIDGKLTGDNTYILNINVVEE